MASLPAAPPDFLSGNCSASPPGLTMAGRVEGNETLPHGVNPSLQGLATAPRDYVARRLRGWKRTQRYPPAEAARSEEHTSELQSLLRISYAVFCLKQKPD